MSTEKWLIVILLVFVSVVIVVDKTQFDRMSAVADRAIKIAEQAISQRDDALRRVEKP